MWSVFSRYSHFGREPLWLYFILVFIFRRWSRWDTRELMKHFAVLGYDMLVSLSCASRILNTCSLGGQLLQNSPVLGTVAVFLDRGYPSMFIAWRDWMVRKRLYFNFGAFAALNSSRHADRMAVSNYVCKWKQIKYAHRHRVRQWILLRIKWLKLKHS